MKTAVPHGQKYSRTVIDNSQNIKNIKIFKLKLKSFIVE